MDEQDRQSDQRRHLTVVVRLIAAGLAGGATAAGLIEHGFYEPPLPRTLLHTLQIVLMAAWGVVSIAERHRLGRIIASLEGSGFVHRLVRSDAVGGVWRRRVDWALLAVAAAGAAIGFFAPALGWGAVHAAAGLALLVELWRLNAHLSRRLRDPGVLFPGSFLFLIGVGTLLIKLPVCVPPGERLAWTDALFTMTSAVCVTGLTVVDTATAFTPFGQFLIALFFQLGGLGIIIFGSTLALLLGARLTLRENLNLSHALDEYPAHEIASFVRFVVLTTLGIELIGAILLFVLWSPGPGQDAMSLSQRAGWSAFHSVSAFCNAGFDITGASMTRYRDSPLTHLVIAPLIVLGSLGFVVLQELWRLVHGLWSRGRGAAGSVGSAGGGIGTPRRRLSLHARLVLWTSLALYLVGLALIFASQTLEREILPAMSPLEPIDPAGFTRGPLGDFLDAHFMSITARSGGFASMPMAELQPGSRLVLMLLMFAGGSPGGTGGGVKTTVFAVLFLAVLATLRRRGETEFGRRAIADVFVKRASAIAFCIAFLIALVTLTLSMIEQEFPLEPLLFEAVSATTTTGLSLGLAPLLSNPGKLVLVVAMFLGRVGPLVMFGVLLFGGRRGAHYAYPHEPVALG